MEQNSFKTEILKFVEKLDKFSNLLTEAKKRTFSEELEKSFESSIEKVASLKNSIQDGKLRIALVFVSLGFVENVFAVSAANKTASVLVQPR